MFFIKPEPMVDPRGAFRRPPSKLANRHGSLKGKNILLFDNTQLTTELPNFGPMFQWLAPYLEARQGAICSHDSRNLLKSSKDDIIALAEELSRSGKDGVVIALSKGGITQGTTIFAAELEQRGLPCVQVCTEIGYPLAGVTASRYVPGLPIVLASRATGDKDNFGKAETEAIAPEIVAGLTEEPGILLEKFNQKFPSNSPSIASEGKMQLPPLEAAAPTANSVRVDGAHFTLKLYEELCAADMCDGLPVIPPTEALVDDMLRYTDFDPEDAIVGEIPPSGAALTVRSLAANAVMAGCRPEYFPILIAAFQAIADPAYRLFQGTITSHSSGHAVIVSGPLAKQVGVHSGAGCLGPGFRANATIGRTVSLAIMNVSRAIPAKTDLSVFGSPAEFTYCFAESDENNPWQPLHTELYGPEVTSVTVHKCEGPHNVLDPRGSVEDLLKTISATGATPGGNNIVHLGQLLVILNPVQARKIAQAGWSKKDVKEFIFETARHPRSLAERQGYRASFPPYFLKLDQVPVMRGPEDVIVVVCGGRGGHAMVGVPWGRAKASSRPVASKGGTPIMKIGPVR